MSFGPGPEGRGGGDCQPLGLRAFFLYFVHQTFLRPSEAHPLDTSSVSYQHTFISRKAHSTVTSLSRELCLTLVPSTCINISMPVREQYYHLGSHYVSDHVSDHVLDI